VNLNHFLLSDIICKTFYLQSAYHLSAAHLA